MRATFSIIAGGTPSISMIVPLAHVIQHAAVGEKAARIIHDDRRLLEDAHEIERRRQRDIARFLAENDFDEQHFFDRRKEMNADEIVRAGRCLGQRGDRQRRRVGGEDHIGSNRLLRAPRRLGLHAAILEHRLEHEIATLQAGVIGGRLDAREQRCLIGGGRASARDLSGDQLFAAGLALVGALLIAVEQHHLEPVAGAHISDAGAHEARADDADLLEIGRRNIFRAMRALVQLVFGEKQRANHRGGFLRAQNMREPARLDCQRLIHRQLQPLIDRCKMALAAG